MAPGLDPVRCVAAPAVLGRVRGEGPQTWRPETAADSLRRLDGSPRAQLSESAVVQSISLGFAALRGVQVVEAKPSRRDVVPEGQGEAAEPLEVGGAPIGRKRWRGRTGGERRPVT